MIWILVVGGVMGVWITSVGVSGWVGDDWIGRRITHAFINLNQSNDLTEVRGHSSLPFIPIPLHPSPNTSHRVVAMKDETKYVVAGISLVFLGCCSNVISFEHLMRYAKTQPPFSPSPPLHTVPTAHTHSPGLQRRPKLWKPADLCPVPPHRHRGVCSPHNVVLPPHSKGGRGGGWDDGIWDPAGQQDSVLGVL